MKVDWSVRTHIEAIFQPLNRRAAARAFPPMASLSEALGKQTPAKTTGASIVNVRPQVSAMFATASVDMWMRAVHSFLVSSSLTNVSDIWASVAGYYSSHYSIRAFAHLFGYFHLHTQRKTVQLRLDGGRHVCEYHSKSKSDREHVAYWKLVKREGLFISDPLFTENTAGGTVPADVAHRDRANYIDHLAQFATFRPLDEGALKNRIDRISGIEFSTPPIPDVARYPNVEAVQVVAYHRLVRYRDVVDSILGSGNRFWSVHRNPAWASNFVDYQLTPQAAMRAPSNK